MGSSVLARRFTGSWLSPRPDTVDVNVNEAEGTRSVVGPSGEKRAPRAFISYARVQGDTTHIQSVENFWAFLRACGIDAQLDTPAGDQRREWTLWMADQIREADYVLVIASKAYRERAEGRGAPDDGRGVQWEARLIRDAFYTDQMATNRFLPVVLPGESSEGIPDFFAPKSATVYHVSEYTVAGAEPLVRLLTSQPGLTVPALGPMPTLPPRPTSTDTVPASRPRRDEQQPAGHIHNELSGNVSGTVIQVGHVDRYVSSPVDTHPESPPQRPTYQVGVGVAGWRQTFERGHRLLSERSYIDVGPPTTPLEQYGPGVRQEFGDWVLCALNDGRTAAVPDTVWDAMHSLSSMALPPGSVQAIGFPVPHSDNETMVVIDRDATSINLDGGTWGPGWLHRVHRDGDWEWQPDPDSFSGDTTRVATRWTGDPQTLDLRVRVIASYDIARSKPWQIDPDRREVFHQGLPDTEFESMLTGSQGLALAEDWERGPYPNLPDRASYSWSANLGLMEVVVVAAADNGTGNSSPARISGWPIWREVVSPIFT
jgi:hypothetical protein